MNEFDIHKATQIIIEEIQYNSGRVPISEMVDSLLNLAEVAFNLERKDASNIIAVAIQQLISTGDFLRETHDDEEYLINPRYEREIIEKLARSLQEAIELNPKLQDVDLIIEAGVGTGRLLREAIRAIFPNALYVGTDLFFNEDKRVRNAAPADYIIGLMTGTLDPENEILCANAFDQDLVHDLLEKTGRNNALLVSNNALFALLDNKMNFWESKDSDDRFNRFVAFGHDSPFLAHLHLNAQREVWSDEVLAEKTAISKVFPNMEDSALNQGWQADRLDYGLLLSNPN